MHLSCHYCVLEMQLLSQLGNVLMKPLNDLIHVLKCFAVLPSYVPALRPLRQQAFLLSFPQTQPSRLTQRLSEVSARRELKHERGHLADQHQHKFIVCRSHCGRA